MTQRDFRALIVVAMAGLLAACETSKTSNPLSPTVAGPIEGVVISAPKPLTPSAGQRIAVADQPVTLTVENATTNGQRPLTYVFEIAADAGFTNKLFTRQDVLPGTDGRTSVRLGDSLAAGRTYYWRAMAADGANSGPYATAAHFDVYTPVSFQAPGPLSPADGAVVTALRPAFRVSNAARTGQAGVVSYNFQVSETPAFGTLALNGVVTEQSVETTYTATSDLTYGKTYYWRARALDASVTGPWSATLRFKMTDAPGTPGPTPGPIPAGDQIDPYQITWLEAASTNVSAWAVTSQVTDVQQSGDQVCLYHTKSGQWPLADVFGTGLGIEGTFMIVARFDGRWYGAAFDWMPGGRACKNLAAEEYGRDQVRVPPMDASWRGPQPGDRIGLLITTPASNRIQARTVNERTNIVVITWK
jgi:hypothetical protein